LFEFKDRIKVTDLLYENTSRINKLGEIAGL